MRLIKRIFAMLPQDHFILWKGRKESKLKSPIDVGTVETKVHCTSTIRLSENKCSHQQLWQ